MATITTDTFLDGGVARTAGEAWTINSGAKFTIRTDSRWHLNSPASYTGSLGSITCNEGEVIFDATHVRWLAINNGSGTPAIGDTVSQGGVSGYYLGFWSSLTAQPTLAIGASGFIKLREVTGGTFSAGSLTFSGAGAANATSADVSGWLEVVADAGTTMTFPRLGKHTIRGDWFYLENTNGSIAQTIQMPTNGGGANTFCPGIWVETAPSSDSYEYFPSLNATTGWTRQHLGAALGETDARQNFVKNIGNGQVQFGEASNLSCSYVNTPSQTTTYATVAHSSTYTVVDNLCTITYATGHLLKTGAQVGVDFTSGGASALDGIFTITVIDAFTYNFALTTGNTSGNATVRPGVTMTFPAHTLGVGDVVYSTKTTGTLPDGAYTIYAVTSANAYLIAYPHTAALSAGSTAIQSRYTIIYDGAVAADFMNLTHGNRVYLDFTSGNGTDGLYTIVYPYVTPVVQASTYTWAANVVTVTFTAHGRKVGDRIFVDFTSGGGTPDGIYTIASVVNANSYTFALTGSGTSGNCSIYHASFDVVANNSGSADSGNVTVKQTIGNIPQSGCRTRIPNVIMRECATGTRASNQVTATIATRPEWATTSAGAIDFEYAYMTWYMNFGQPYSVRLYNSSTFDSLIATEVATALDIDNMHTAMYGNQDVPSLNCTSDFAGGTIKNSKFQRGNTPGSNGHAIIVAYCNNITFTNVTGGIIQYPRSSGQGWALSYNNGCVFTNCRGINTGFPLTTCLNVTVNSYDHCDRYIGYTNTTSPYFAFTMGAGCSGIDVNGVTFGFGGTIPNVHPYTGIFSITANSNCKFRNAGSRTIPLACGSWRTNLYALRVSHTTGGNNNAIKLQRIYLDDNAGTGVFTTVNSDKNMTYESLHNGMYVMSAMAVSTQIDAGLNSIIKNGRAGNTTVAGQASVYGNHFRDIFLGDTTGRFILAFNEPTAETASQFTMVSGTAKFNSAGGILMGAIGDKAIFEDSCFRLGHTGFMNTTPTMSGGTIGNYTLEYQIDIGSGYNGTWEPLNGANLSAITVNPVIGFKMKIQITTTSTNSAPITYLRIDTISTLAGQQNVYPLDTITLTITGLQLGSDVVVYRHSDMSVLGSVDANSASSWSYIYTTAQPIDIGVFKAGYVPFYIRDYSLETNNASLPVAQVVDRAYLA